METKELADKVMADLIAIRAELKDFKGPIKDIVRNIPDVVFSVEKLAADCQLVGDKKKEVAVLVLNKLIDIPWVPESAEAVLIGFGIDAVVAAFNKFGKDWIKKI
jgi:hypothetical protein